MPGQHKHPPIAYRPPEVEREWLRAEAEATGLAVNAIITEAIRFFREHRPAPQQQNDSEKAGK